MSLDNFIPSVWSSRLYVALKKAHVFPNLVNTDYEGEISGYGDTVKINTIGAITIGAYTKNSDMNAAETLSDAQTELKIDQAKYFNFQIDDIDKAQQKPKVMDQAMQEAGFGLADVVDQHIAGLHGKAAQTVTETSLTAAKIIGVLAEASQKLSEKSVPTEGRWMVLPPFATTLLTEAEVGETDGSIVADESYRRGYVMRAFGFDIFMSNNLKVVSTNTIGLAGTRRAISFAEQIVSMKAYEQELRFNSAVKGLHVYGTKVVDPNALVKLTLKV